MIKGEYHAKISVVTDSTADVPESLREQFHIQIVPNVIVINGKSYLDGIDLSRRSFYETLPSLKVPPTTATASSGEYEKVYHSLFDQGVEHIFSIHASSRLSGIFNAASIAAQAFAPHVSVIDSQHITMGLGFQVLAAAKGASLGVPLKSILRLVENTRRRVKVIALLDTLEYVRRSGRVSWARARLGNLLRIKPIVEVTRGQVRSLGEVRTFQSGFKRLLDLLEKLGPLEQLAILHTNAEARALHFQESIQQPLQGQIWKVNVTTVIGTHVGPNGLGFAALIK